MFYTQQQRKKTGKLYYQTFAVEYTFFVFYVAKKAVLIFLKGKMTQLSIAGGTNRHKKLYKFTMVWSGQS